MAITFSSVSHRVHADLGKSIPLGHVHQLVAAALGYKSLAAYHASKVEPPTFDDVEHVVFDDALLNERQLALGHVDPPNGPWLSHALRGSLQSMLPNVGVHLSQADLTDNIQNDVEQTIDDSDEYGSELAMTNAYGPGSYSLDFSAQAPLSTFATDWVMDVEGTSSLDHDPDKVFHGDEIQVWGEVRFPKLGRRLLGEYEVEEIGASSDGGSEDVAEPDGP